MLSISKVMKKLFKSNLIKFTLEFAFTVSIPIAYVTLNEPLRKNFPEETFLLNSWNLFSTLYSNNINAVGLEPSLTAFASIPNFLLSPLFNYQNPFNLLYLTLVIRTSILCLIMLIFLRNLSKNPALRIVAFYTFFFTTTNIIHIFKKYFV